MIDTSNISKNCLDAANVMKILANDKRLQILCAIWQEEKNVGELEDIIGLSQSALSQHLARLRRDGVVKTRRDAQTIYYSILCPRAKIMMEALSTIYGTDCGANTSRT